MQSLAHIAKQVQLPEEKVTDVMEKLSALGLIWQVSAEISDTPSNIYGFVNNTPLVGLLVLAKSLTQYIQFHDLYVDTWNHLPWYRPQKDT